MLLQIVCQLIFIWREFSPIPQKCRELCQGSSYRRQFEQMTLFSEGNLFVIYKIALVTRVYHVDCFNENGCFANKYFSKWSRGFVFPGLETLLVANTLSKHYKFITLSFKCLIKCSFKKYTAIILPKSNTLIER